ncbi:MAG: hypoxanthine phosphoribosyltransferase [Bifidobacteriaceae bacterium]|jgi:hypoxanthine phosphoribosyltransferase|nr:hypoxanthine phosphoribosyltransferase [Bifidobacteriaceae bacterium]
MTLSETYENDIKKVLITEEQLENRLSELASQIDSDYKGKDLLVIGILKGAIFTITKLASKIKKNVEIDFITLSSYGSDTKSSGDIKLIMDLDENVKDRNILVVEDIIDTGLTMKWLIEYLQSKGAASVEVCTLLRKKEAHIYDVSAKYVGFEVPEVFVVGFGLDYNQYYRNIPYIGVLKEEIYEK